MSCTRDGFWALWTPPAISHHRVAYSTIESCTVTVLYCIMLLYSSIVVYGLEANLATAPHDRGTNMVVNMNLSSKILRRRS